MYYKHIDGKTASYSQCNQNLEIILTLNMLKLRDGQDMLCIRQPGTLANFAGTMNTNSLRHPDIELAGDSD